MNSLFSFLVRFPLIKLIGEIRKIQRQIDLLDSGKFHPDFRSVRCYHCALRKFFVPKSLPQLGHELRKEWYSDVQDEAYEVHLS